MNSSSTNYNSKGLINNNKKQTKHKQKQQHWRMSIFEIYWTALHHTTETRRAGWCGGVDQKKHEKQTL